MHTSQYQRPESLWSVRYMAVVLYGVMHVRLGSKRLPHGAAPVLPTCICPDSLHPTACQGEPAYCLPCWQPWKVNRCNCCIMRNVLETRVSILKPTKALNLVCQVELHACMGTLTHP